MSFTALERRDHIAIVSLDRPEAHNALSGAMASELTDVFTTIASDSDTWVVVLRANGDKAFCVGADLKERGSLTLEDFHNNRKQVRGMFEALRKVPQPVVCAPFGFALGGGFELVLSCDIVVAAMGTVMGLPEARVGLLPAGGGTQLLPRKIGLARAKELILRGRRIEAGEALEMGIVARVVDRAHLDEGALEAAREICECSPVAVRAAKAAMDAGLGLPIDDGIEVENDVWGTVIASDDRAEGIAAFNEKRAPRWSNR